MSVGINSSGGANRLRFENFSGRLQKITIDVVHRTRSTGSLGVNTAVVPSSGQLGCYLQDELIQLKCLDTSSSFKK